MARSKNGNGRSDGLQERLFRRDLELAAALYEERHGKKTNEELANEIIAMVKNTPDVKIKLGGKTIKKSLIKLMEDNARPSDAAAQIRAAAGKAETLRDANSNFLRASILLEKVAGFQETATALFGKNLRIIYSWANKTNKRNPAIDSDDFVQDFFPYFCANIVKFDKNRGNGVFNTFLGQRLRSFSTSYRRAEGIHHKEMTGFVSDANEMGVVGSELSFVSESGTTNVKGQFLVSSRQDDSLDEIALRNEEIALLLALIAKLPEKERQLLEQRYIKETPLKEMAKVHKQDSSKLGGNLAYILAKLRKELKDPGQEQWVGYVTKPSGTQGADDLTPTSQR